MAYHVKKAFGANSEPPAGHTTHSIPASMGPGTWEVWAPNAFLSVWTEEVRDGLSRVEHVGRTGQQTRLCGWTDGGVTIHVATEGVDGTWFDAAVTERGLPTLQWAESGVPTVTTQTVAEYATAALDGVHFRFHPDARPEDVRAASSSPLRYSFTGNLRTGGTYYKQLPSGRWGIKGGPRIQPGSDWICLALPTGYRSKARVWGGYYQGVRDWSGGRVTVLAGRWFGGGVYHTVEAWDSMTANPDALASAEIDLDPWDALWVKADDQMADPLEIEVEIF